MDRAVDPMALADALGIPRDEAKVLLTAGDHAYNCRCDTCREGWRLIGPDPDTGELASVAQKKQLAELEGDGR